MINRLLYGLFVFNYIRMIAIGLLLLIMLVLKNMFKGKKAKTENLKYVLLIQSSLIVSM